MEGPQWEVGRGPHQTQDRHIPTLQPVKQQVASPPYPCQGPGLGPNPHILTLHPGREQVRRHMFWCYILSNNHLSNWLMQNIDEVI